MKAWRWGTQELLEINIYQRENLQPEYLKNIC